jgi:hypothetical protein
MQIALRTVAEPPPHPMYPPRQKCFTSDRLHERVGNLSADSIYPPTPSISNAPHPGA